MDAGIPADVLASDVWTGIQVLDFLGDMTTLDIFGQGIPAVAEYLSVDNHATDIRGDIVVDVLTLDIPADVLVDFQILDMLALDILVDMSSLGFFDLEIDDIIGLDILVDMPTFDIPVDVLADLSIHDMAALDILGFGVEDILVHCIEAAAVGSPACLMLVCGIPAAVSSLTGPSSLLGFVLITP